MNPMPKITLLCNLIIIVHSSKTHSSLLEANQASSYDYEFKLCWLISKKLPIGNYTSWIAVIIKILIYFVRKQGSFQPVFLIPCCGWISVVIRTNPENDAARYTHVLVASILFLTTVNSAIAGKYRPSQFPFRPLEKLESKIANSENNTIQYQR